MPKLIHYRDKCIGCGICFELQPDIWRMSKRDGKATLVKAIRKGNVYVLEVNEQIKKESFMAAEACPVKVIKIS